MLATQAASQGVSQAASQATGQLAVQNAMFDFFIFVHALFNHSKSYENPRTSFFVGAPPWAQLWAILQTLPHPLPRSLHGTSLAF